MNNASFDVVTFAFGALALSGLWHLLFFLYARYAIDRFRQDIFRIRDEMFAEAAAGNVPFDATAYVMLRRTMNGFIRYAHRLGFSHFVAASWLSAQGGSRFPSDEGHYANRLKRALLEVEPEQRELLESYQRRMHFLVLKRMTIGSPMALITIVPVAVVAVMKNQIVSALIRGFDQIDDRAAAVGRGQRFA